MKIPDKETRNAYPKLYKHISTLLPVYPRYIPKRYKAYEKYCGSEALAKQGIKWGDNPRLQVAYTEAILPDKTVANGFFWATHHEHRIVIDIRNAKKFEKDAVKYELALQYLLLHEMIHWARHHAGLAADVAPNRGLRPGEAGDEFEAEAYGKDVSYLWDL